MIKELIYHEDITVLNASALNNRTSKHLKHKVREKQVKRETSPQMSLNIL